MKKFLSIALAVTMLALTMVSCTNEDNKTEKTTKPEVSAEITDNSTLVIENEKYKFTVQKTDFEKNYSDELLMKMYALFPEKYGFDDYGGWDGTPEEVINDAVSANFSLIGPNFFEMYEEDSPEYQEAVAEIEGYGYSLYYGYVITDIDKLNSYIADRFGPFARVFASEDFDTYEEAVTQDGITDSEGIGFPGFRYIYLSESEMIACFYFENTGYGGALAVNYIYDVQTVNGGYVVKAISNDNYHDEYDFENFNNADTFEELQSESLKIYENHSPEVLDDYTMVIGETEDGDLYVMSVTKTQLTSEK